MDDHIIDKLSDMVGNYYERDLIFEDTNESEAGKATIITEKDLDRLILNMDKAVSLGLIEGDFEDEDSFLELMMTYVRRAEMSYVAYATTKLAMRGDLLPTFIGGEWQWLPTEEVEDRLEDF